MARGDMAARTVQQGEVLDPQGGGVVSESLAIGLTRAEVDQQIATAKRYPRQTSIVQKRILELATLDEPTAQEMIYARPQAGEVIRGPSIRFAELLLQSWGNARCGSRTVHVDQTYVEAEGVYHDLETNTATTQRVRRRIIKRDGGRYAEDQILVTANAAGSIARRNAILGGIPKPIWRAAIEAVEQLLKGDAKTLVQRRKALLDYLKTQGVETKRVLGALGIAGAEDISLDHLLTLHGLAAAMKNGEGTIDELFPVPEPETAGGRPKADLKGQLQGGEGDKPNGDGFSRDHVHNETSHVAPKNGKDKAPDGDQKKTAGAEGKPGAAEPGSAVSEAQHSQTQDTPSLDLGGGDANSGEATGQGEAEGEPEGAAAKVGEVLGDDDLPDALRGVSDGTQAGPDAAGEAEQPQEQGDAPTDPIQVFSQRAPKIDTWVELKQSFVGLSKLDDFNELEPDDQDKVRAFVWDCAAAMTSRGSDKVDPALDVTAFRCWIVRAATKHDGDTIRGTLSALETTPAWEALNETQKTSVRKIADRFARLADGV